MLLSDKWRNTTDFCEYDPMEDRELRARLGQRLPQAFIVHCQNIYDWVKTLRWPMRASSLTPNCKMPFRNMYFEFETIDGDDRGIQGSLLSELSPSDEEERDILHRNGFVSLIEHDGFFDWDNGITPFREVIGLRQDLRTLAIWICLPGEFPAALRIRNFPFSLKQPHCGLDGSQATIFAAISFFHCKNVTIRKVERPAPLQKKFKRRHGIEMPSFHVIEVHKATKHTMSEMQTTREAREARASFVRGHFKDFGETGKLFGKHMGLWFWNMHVRGDGAPLKSEYRPWPPEGRHRKQCIVQISERDARLKGRLQ